MRSDRGNDVPRVWKRRRFYAPLLVWASGPAFFLLGTGIRVLPQREWEDRERRMYEAFGRGAVRRERGALVMPALPGVTLARLLADPAVSAADRRTAIELSVRALADLHGAGFTHGDAMAENVLVDLGGGTAHWIDFETRHVSSRRPARSQADDLRALLATALVPVGNDAVGPTLSLIVDAYPADEVRRLLAQHFARILHRPLAFHLGQAPLPLARYRAIARLLTDRFVRASVR